jgi:uncharacterized protein
MNIFENKFFQFLIFVLVIMIIGFFGVTINRQANASDNTNLISVTGTGDVYTTPDIATVDISVVTEKTQIAAAMSENTQKMNDIISFIKGEGVGDNDITTTNFNISPIYQYDKNGTRSLQDYQVSQSLTVKIRDLTKIGDILSGATLKGANTIGDLSFTVDNDDQVKADAKAKAITDAKTKAKTLEKELGIKLIKIVNFSESSYAPVTIYNNSMKLMTVAGSSADSSPTIQTGQNKITSTVTITYAIR